MGKSGQGFSFPRLIGWASLALGLAYLGFCVLTPPAMGDQLFLGLHWTGPLAWATTLAHAAFFFWLALVALRRRAVAVWGAIGYSVYLIENIWIYSVGEGSQALPSVRSMLIVNAVVTSILLTFCRVLLARRDEFDA